MNEHLTEQQLIDYVYRLASDAAAQNARNHLDACDECRRTLERLRAKLASLELLRDEIQPSDALVARVLADAAKPRRAAIFPYRHVFSVSATAAVFIGGIIWLLFNVFAPDRRAEQAPVREFARQEDQRPMKSDGREDFAMRLAAGRSVPRPDDGVPAAEPPAPALASVTAKPVAEQPTEKPPFAPASAIELVVLPRRENVQLTIYNSADLTLVRERRNLTLKPGWNWLQFMWADTLIDPTSLTLEPLEHEDQVEIQQLVFPPRLRELGRWLVRSGVSGQVPFELTYLTSGLSWRAFYMGTLTPDEKTMHLEGYVRVDNRSGEDYEDAQTRLIVGKVHLLDQIRELARRQYPYGRPVTFGRGMMGGMGGRLEGAERKGETLLETRAGWINENGVLDIKQIIKEGLSEYFLYTIEGTETIPNEWGKRLLSFETDAIPVENLYKYDEERFGPETVRFLSFANDTDHKLGETPIPDGTLKAYRSVDDQKHLSYEGQSAFKYIPVGGEVELNLGPARLVKVEPTLMETATTNYVFDNNDDVGGWDDIQTWKIEVTNPRTLPVEIEITRGFDTPCWTLTVGADGVAYTKHDVAHARFTLSVEPRSKRTFTYTVTAYRGMRRSEYYLKQDAENRP